MSKRGLSDVVTTVLLILLVLASVVIIWNFVRPFVNSAANLDPQAYTTRLSVPESSVYLDPNSETLSLSIKRDAGDGDVTGFVFGIEDPSGAVRTFRQNFTLNEYELRNFEVNYSQFMIDDVVSVTVTPIFRNNNTGEETFGQPIQQPVKNKTSFKLPNGLVAHWKFDGNWVDGINSLNGGAVGAATFDYTNKKVGQASGSFTGSTSAYTQVTDNSLLNPSSFTVVTWVNPTNLQSSSFSEIILKSTTVNGFSLQFVRSRLTWEFATNGGASGQRSVVGVPVTQTPLGSFSFFAVVRDPSQIGIFVNEYANISSPPYGYQSSNGQPLNIGRSFSGNVDEVMFFNRALTVQEISDIRTKYK